MAYDEELMMREVEIGLSITPDIGKASVFSSKSQFLMIAILATAIVVTTFFAVLYKFILPEHIRDKIFGCNNRTADEEKSVWETAHAGKADDVMPFSLNLLSNSIFSFLHSHAFSYAFCL